MARIGCTVLSFTLSHCLKLAGLGSLIKPCLYLFPYFYMFLDILDPCRSFSFWMRTLKSKSTFFVATSLNSVHIPQHWDAQYGWYPLHNVPHKNNRTFKTTMHGRVNSVRYYKLSSRHKQKVTKTKGLGEEASNSANVSWSVKLLIVFVLYVCTVTTSFTC